jgi:DNA-binding response OmpR family regulator
MNQVILIVDDDEVLGQILGRVLTRDGYEVVRATTASQALQLAREHQPQLALLDLCLPDCDGQQLAQSLQAEWSDMLLVLMTAYPLRLLDQPGSAERFAQVLTKPLDLRELRRTIAAALAVSTADASAVDSENSPGSMTSPSGTLD